MLPIKLKALNQESDDEDIKEEENKKINPELTKEALEQKAHLQYRNALNLQNKNRLKEAESALIELLQTEIIKTTGKVQYENGILKPSLAHLKYCCLVNIGNVKLKENNYRIALKYFLQAIELDNTDLNLLYRIGDTALKLTDLNLAVTSFIQALNCSHHHWPSLDSLITASYAMLDFMTCLTYISEALALDSSYMKGIAFKEKIFEEHPTLKDHFKAFHPELDIRCDLTFYDADKAKEWFETVDKLREQDPSMRSKAFDEEIIEFGLLKPLLNYTWIALGNSILKLYQFLYIYYSHVGFCCKIDLNAVVPRIIKKWARETEECSIRTDNTDGYSSTAGVFDTSEIEIEENLSEQSESSESEKEQISEFSSRKRRKPSPTLAEQLRMCDKRRSSRNRTSVKSSEASLSKSLRNIIPLSLLPQKDVADPTRWYDESAEVMDICRILDNQEFLTENALPSHPKKSFSESARVKLIKSESYFGTEKEENDVKNFITMNTSNLILDILYNYICCIASKWHYTWSRRLYQLFMEVYRHLSNHGVCGHKIANVRLWEWQESSYEEEFAKARLNEIRDDVNVVLLYGELLIDLWYENIAEAPVKYSLLKNDFNALIIGDLNDVCNFLHNVIDKDIAVRSYWLEALLYLQEHNTGAAYIPLQMLQMILEDDDFELRLPHMKNYYVISDLWVRRLMNTLQRHLYLQQVDGLYSNERYEDVIEILKGALEPGFGNEIFILPDEQTIPRYKQYGLLLASYWQIRNEKNFTDVFKWCEVACYEAFTMYRKCFFDDSSTQEKASWSNLVVNSMHGILTCLETVDSSRVSEIPGNILVRVVQTLTNLICYQIESSDQIPEIMTDVITPWLILYNILASRENNRVTESGEWYAPPSISLLFLAHEYLGRRNWCCFDDGGLLFYILDVVQPILDECEVNSEGWHTLVQEVDQIFYCLYAHPCKRNKARYVQEHNSLGLALTWNRAIQAFQFYKPKLLPTFDAVSKFQTISADTESLLQRIVPLIPAEQNPARLMDLTMQYIGGNIDSMCQNNNPLPEDISDLFYLLGDYHFKNKVWSKALRYYMLDVCTNPNRVDSWAAMALARGSQLETKLNSCETIKNESDILKRIDITARCYKTALNLDYKHATLWIEYGVFTYSSHAFCSRLLKQETTNMSLQMFEMLETHKQELIKISEECFNSAEEVWSELTRNNMEVQDERWLHNYMLGKIAEKQEKKPYIFLSCYYKAAELLRNNGAEYPERITYNNPEYYSVEALEIHYRVHATMLKMLETHEEKLLDDEALIVVTKILHLFKDSAFASAIQRNKPEQIEDSSCILKYFENVKDIEERVQDRLEDLIRINGLSNKRWYSNENNDSTKTMAKKMKLDKDLKTVAADSAIRNSAERIVPDCLADAVKESEQSFQNSISDEVRLSTAVKKARKSPSNTESQSSSGTSSSNDDSSSDSSSSYAESNLSSEEDVSGASSSTNSESESEETKTERKENKHEKKMRILRISVQKYLTRECLSALQVCAQRFREHYKTKFRLSNHYIRSKYDRNLEMCRKLLLAENGLFYDRKPSNFFHGIWRIPTGEIDRPGSFAFHMARCVHLLMDVSRNTRDHKMLLTLCIQLKDMPEPDKKYLRDNEREQLGFEIVSVCAQVMRKNIESTENGHDFISVYNLLLDAYKCYFKISKHYSSKEPIYGKLLMSCYRKCTGKKANLEQIVQFCKNLKSATQSGNIEEFLQNNEMPEAPVLYEIPVEKPKLKLTALPESLSQKSIRAAEDAASSGKSDDQTQKPLNKTATDINESGGSTITASEVVSKTGSSRTHSIVIDLPQISVIKTNPTVAKDSSSSKVQISFKNRDKNHDFLSNMPKSNDKKPVDSGPTTTPPTILKAKRIKDSPSSYTQSKDSSSTLSPLTHHIIESANKTQQQKHAVEYKSVITSVKQPQQTTVLSKATASACPPAVSVSPKPVSLPKHHSKSSHGHSLTSAKVTSSHSPPILPSQSLSISSRQRSPIDFVLSSKSVSISTKPLNNQSSKVDISFTGDRPNLIITPLAGNSGGGNNTVAATNMQTLQQKLAAKQNANKSTQQQQHNSKSEGGGGTKSQQKHDARKELTHHILNQSGLTITPVVRNNASSSSPSSTSSSHIYNNKHSVSISKVNPNPLLVNKNPFSLPTYPPPQSPFKVPNERKTTKNTSTTDSAASASYVKSSSSGSISDFQAVIKNLDSIGTKLSQRKSS